MLLLGLLSNNVRHRINSFSILYFTTFLLPAFSLFGDGDTHYFERLIPGSVPLFSTTTGHGRLCRLSGSFLNKLSLIQGPCAEAERPLHETQYLQFSPSSFQGISPQRRIKIKHISRCFRESGVSSLSKLTQYKKDACQVKTRLHNGGPSFDDVMMTSVPVCIGSYLSL